MEVAIISAIAVIVTAIITHRLTRKNQIKFEERKLKETYYIQYIKALSDNINIDDPKEAMRILHYAHNNLLLVASTDVVNKLIYFTDMITLSGEKYCKTYNIKKNSKEYQDEYAKRLTELMIAFRYDLLGKRKNDKSYPTVKLLSIK